MNKGIDFGLTLMKPIRISIFSILMVLAGWTFNADAITKTNLHLFLSFPNDGAYPEAGLVQGSDGNFYGTTDHGGTSSNCTVGCGTIFRISPSGTYTTLHSFVGSPNDGAAPIASLVQGSDGSFYGVTAQGGTSTNCGLYGCGTIFRISPGGSCTSLYSFAGSPNDGSSPFAGLVQGSDGNFYGMTYYGGTSTNCSGGGCGTIFRISPSGTYTSLHYFVGYPTDGSLPGAQLAQGSDGNFYGTTDQGGTSTNCGTAGCGTVFRISPSGNKTNLYSFGNIPDGAYSLAGLVQGSDGNFYGTTAGGGGTGLGTVFRISFSGTYTNLYSFGNSPDGNQPEARLAQGSDGYFYGTAYTGGKNGIGTVFRISPGGSYTSLYSFVTFLNEGRNPVAGLVQGTDGSFYGTTHQGGTNDNGTVFKLTIPLNPPPFPINQITGVQLSGTNIIFNIPSIAYETYQLQFSSSMNPTNWVNVPVSVTNSIGALLTLTNFGGAVGPQGLYRFDITP